jgi:hypothetical protein
MLHKLRIKKEEEKLPIHEACITIPKLDKNIIGKLQKILYEHKHKSP